MEALSFSFAFFKDVDDLIEHEKEGAGKVFECSGNYWEFLSAFRA
jgi:hypothetical protein